MRTRINKTDYLLSLIREGKKMALKQQLKLTVYLSIPAIMTQLSSIVMQYVDASMVGSLGANASASIGLVSTTTWLFWGSKKNFTSIHYCDIAIRLFISSYRSFHQ